MRALVKPALGAERVPIAARRRWLELLAATPLPRGTSVRREAVGGVPCEVVTASGATGPGTVVHLHSGGFTTGSARVHRALAAHLSRAAGVPVVVVDYRLAPEHPYPAGLDDAVAVFRTLEGPVAVSGDSAGGGLAMSLALRQRDEGWALPVAVAVQSPAVDLTLSHVLRSDRPDVVLSKRWMQANARDYAPGLDPADPLLSPLHADLRGLPPVRVDVCTDELLHDEGVELGRRLQVAGNEGALVVLEGLWHDVHVHAGLLREADEAVAAVGAWLRAHLAASYSPPHGPGAQR